MTNIRKRLLNILLVAVFFLSGIASYMDIAYANSDMPKTNDPAKEEKYKISQVINSDDIEKEDEYKLSKKVNDAGDEISLSIHGSNRMISKYHTLDIMLVVEKTGSMGNENFKKVKNALNDFLYTMENKSDINKENIRLVLISYAAKITLESDLVSLANTTEIENIKSKIQSLKSSGGTWTDRALTETYKLLQNSTADERIIVLLSDGFPTYYSTENGRKGNGRKTTLEHINKGIEVAKGIKDNGVDITTIRVGLEKKDAKDYMKNLSSDNTYIDV